MKRWAARSRRRRTRKPRRNRRRGACSMSATSSPAWLPRHPPRPKQALRLIRAEYQPLPFVVDIESARRSDAPLVFEGPVQGRSYCWRGRRRGAAAAGQRARAQQGGLARQCGARVSRRPTSSSKANSARRCRRTAASRRTRWWRTGGTTASRCTCRPSTRPACAANWRRCSDCRAAVCASSSTRWEAASAPSRAPAITCARPWRCRGRRAPRCGSCSIARKNTSTAATGRRRCSGLRIGARRDGTLTRSLWIPMERRASASVPVSATSPSRFTTARTSISRSPTSSSTPGPGSAMRAPGNVPGAYALEQMIDELGREARHGSARACAIASIPARCGARKGASAPLASAGAGGSAPGSDSGPVKRGIGMAQSYWGANVQHQRIVRGAHPARRLGRAALQRAGHRHRHRHRSRPDRRRGIGPAPRRHRHPHRRHRLPRRAAVVRQHLHTASITPPARNAAYRVLRELFDAVAPALERVAGEPGRARRTHCHRRQRPQHEFSRGRAHACAPSASARWRAARTTMAASAARWATWRPRRTRSAASSLRKWRWISRPASCAWSASWRCRTAAAR